jgi:hypothetical protein
MSKTITAKDKPNEKLTAVWGVFSDKSPFEDKFSCIWRVTYPDGKREFFKDKDFKEQFVEVSK